MSLRYRVEPRVTRRTPDEIEFYLVLKPDLCDRGRPRGRSVLWDVAGYETSNDREVRRSTAMAKALVDPRVCNHTIRQHL